MQPFVSIDCKMVDLSIFSKISPKFFSLTDIFQLHKYHVLSLINVPITRKKQQGSVKFRIWKGLVVKWRSFQYSTNFEKNMSCLHLKEISTTIFFKTLVSKN